MAEVDQHQQPLMHALDRANEAITFAQQARWAMEQAHTAADPQGIQTAHSRLIQAEREVEEAMEQLKHHDTESHHQTILQTMTQLRQASQDLDIATEAYQTPKQVR
jgi:hypothetical protein